MAGSHWRVLLCALFVPGIVVAAIEVVNYEMVESGWTTFGLLLIECLVYTLYATSCHRIVLVGSDALPNRWGLYWTPRETQYFIWALILAAISIPFIAVPFIVLTFLGPTFIEDSTLVLFGCMVPMIYVCSRASVMLPSIAIDNPLAFAEAWELSTNNGWRLTIALTIPILILGSLSYAYYSTIGESESFSASLLSSLWFCLAGAVEVTVLSIAFRELRKIPAEDAA